jgi:hypothetical protein
MSDWRPARETSPPTTEDLSLLLDLTSTELITLNFNDRRYRVPGGTRYIRHGVTQEGFSVDYQDTDGGWYAAEEIMEPPAAPQAPELEA